MVYSLHNNPILSKFGTTGFVGINNLKLLQFNFISRTYLDIFNSNFYPPVLFYIHIYLASFETRPIRQWSPQ